MAEYKLQNCQSFTTNDITIYDATFDTEGMWLMFWWKTDNDEDIMGIALADGDHSGYRYPKIQEQANTIEDFLMTFYGFYLVDFSENCSFIPIVDIIQESWSASVPIYQK